MARRFTLACAVVTFAMALSVAANEKPTADYQSRMKSNGMAVQALRTHVKALDYDAVAYDAYTIRTNMARIEAFWADRMVDDATEFARAVIKGATNVQMAAVAMDPKAMAAGVSAIDGACAACHMAHRERLSDMTFEIK
jgi:hypothetical protein